MLTVCLSYLPAGVGSSPSLSFLFCVSALEQECAAGFYRLRAGWLAPAPASKVPTAAGMGSCVQCQCSGHSSTCDPETSICQVPVCVRSGACVSWVSVSPVISPVIINNRWLSHIWGSFVSLKEALHRGNWCKSHQLRRLTRNHSIRWLNAVRGRRHNTSSQIKSC